jgi:hypothetical protein
LKIILSLSFNAEIMLYYRHTPGMTVPSFSKTTVPLFSLPSFFL